MAEVSIQELEKLSAETGEPIYILIDEIIEKELKTFK